MDFTDFIKGLKFAPEHLVGVMNSIAQVIVMAAAGWAVFFLTKKAIGPLVVGISKQTSFRWDDTVFTPKFFSRLGLLLAPVTIRIILNFIPGDNIHYIHKLVNAWIVISAAMFITTLLYRINDVYNSMPHAKDHPIRIFVQLVAVFFWCAATMVIVSIFTGVAVGGLLGGLTAFAAVLMLIFQDTILGFVAGVQMNTNNLVHIGDWIQMPGRGADGEIIEIGLITVKVQNWDKTIVTIPTHKLVQESFTNWRGMEQSGGRRIKRSVNIDVNSIHFLTDSEIEALRASSLLDKYMDAKLSELQAFNATHSNTLDRRRLTNIGTFREYLEQSLASNPDIRQDMTHMVRQLQPGPTGLPLEIYCFSARQDWVKYEGVQSDIFDHLFAVMGLFGLKAFEYAAVQEPVNGQS